MSPKEIWKKLIKKIEFSDTLKEKGRLLFIEYTKTGSIRDLTAFDSLEVLVDFYKRLSLLRPMSSPIYRRHDDRWFVGSDIQYFSVFQSGTFVKALKDILLCQVDTIILLPVTQCKKEYPLYPLSHSIIDENLADPQLLEWGLSVSDQFHLLIGALHLCQKRVGYYLSPLVSDEAAVLYRRPDLFLWCDKKSQQPLFADIVKEEINSLVEKAGSYDYPQLKNDLLKRKISPVSLERSKEMVKNLALFDLYNQETQAYFSNVFANLQRQFPLDFYYMDYPDSLSYTYVERGTLSLITQANRALKRYTAKVYSSYLVEAPLAPRSTAIAKKSLNSYKLNSYISLWFDSIESSFKALKGPLREPLHLWSLGSFQISFFEKLTLLFLKYFSGKRGVHRSLFLGEESKNPKELLILNQFFKFTEEFQPFLERATVSFKSLEGPLVWWLLEDKKSYMIPYIILDKANSPLVIDLKEALTFDREYTILEYSLNQQAGDLLFLFGSKIDITSSLGEGESRFGFFLIS